MYQAGKIKDNWCTRCRVLKKFCFCEQIPTIDNQIKLIIIMQIRETFLASNSGYLVNSALTNSEIRIRGLEHTPLSLDDLDFETNQYLYLFPSPDSVPLSKSLISDTDKKSVLVVPDGSWRSCKKIINREPKLQQMIPVNIPATEKSNYHLRHTHRENGLSTLEAIARAFSIIEDEKIEQQLTQVFNTMVDIHLKQRQKVRPVSK